MAEINVTSEERVKRPNPPRTRVKSAGKVNRRLEALGAAYLNAHPDRDIRWVYHPVHKPDLSNVLDRSIDGYIQVFVKDLGDEIVALLPGFKSDDPVRVGDVVLMSIEAEVRAGYKQDLAERAREELTRVDHEFYESIEELEVRSASGTKHRSRPKGRSVIEEVERDVDLDPSLVADEPGS